MGDAGTDLRSAAVWQLLTELAMRREKSTYKLLGEAIGEHYRQVGRILEPLKVYCQQQKLPPLTVLVVSGSTGRPGIGSDVPPELAYDEIRRVWDFEWQAICNPFTDSPASQMPPLLAGQKASMRTVSDFGAWVLKCNPAVYRLQDEVADGLTQVSDWSVADNYRTWSMEPGQPVVLWMTGRKLGGIWGIGHITGTARTGIELLVNQRPSPYWQPGVKDVKSRLYVPTEIAILKNIIPREIVEHDRVLRASEVFRQPQMSNPSFLTMQEFEALQRMVPRWPKPPDFASEVVSVGRRGAGFGDSQQNRVVELAAMEAVSQFLKAEGFKVSDVSKQNLGWDLTATRVGTERHVEVKGVAGSIPRVLLTRNEMRACREDADWELAVVTAALDKAQIRFESGDSVASAASEFVWEARFN